MDTQLLDDEDSSDKIDRTANEQKHEKDIDRFYDAIKLDFSGFKFSREEANER